MTSTVAKTYRFSTALYQLIVTEAEKVKTNEAEVVRLAIRSYFERTQEDARLAQIENRLQASISGNAKNLETLIKQVIAMAQP